MPKISALPPAARASQDDEIPANVIAEGETQKLTVQMLMPTGTILDYAGAAAPDGFLLCYGQTLNGSSNPEYADLYDVIGTTYGGTGITSFKVPDLRGRVGAGQDDMGGSSANRLTSPLDGDVLGAAGGTEGHTHDLAGGGAYALLDPDGAGNLMHVRQVTGVTGWSRNVTQAGTVTSAAANTRTDGIELGGTTPSGSSVQPTLILNKIIKY